MKLISSYIKPLWFSIIIVSLLSLLNVAGTLYIPTLTATIINDGVDIRDVSRESLHKTVGMVLQDTWIFTGTITEQGTHHELIKRGGHYKELYENYAAGMTV
ncbi:Lipid A export ATP-binding/permease protein MsbA [Veillonella parvula HSIVP1]|nr:Lipid A export ATP-binding/permease MsbA [Veillonella parvula]EQC67499.1 Lipid A export ATP-binding/permease protein MsbA [Veillonella parvula HSIVP1]